MSRISIYLLLLISFLLPALSGCRQSIPVTPSGKNAPREKVAGRPGGNLVFRLTASPKTFNPLIAFDDMSLLVNYFLLHSRLVDFDHDTRRPAPALAESWKTEADGRTVNIKLRDGLKFSDGHALSAEDVEFTLKTIYDERTKAPILRGSMLIEGQPITVKVQDARNLQFILPRPVASLENYLTNLVILPRHVLETAAKEGTAGTVWGLDTDPNTMVTSGPFTVGAVQQGAQLTLKRNPHYWKKDANGTPLPYLEQVSLPFIADANNAMAQLGQGSLDIIDRIRPADYAALQAAPGKVASYDLGPGLGIDHLWFNLSPRKAQSDATKYAWFQDVRFRRAVSHAIDRETITKTTLQGLATPLYGFVSPTNTIWAAKDLPRTEYDLEKARALLREAGFTVKGDANAPELSDKQGQRVEFTLMVQAESEPRKLVAAVVQEDLAKLGIKMQVTPVETPNLNQRWKDTQEYDAALYGMTTTDLEPSSYSGVLRSDSDSHYWSPKQPKPATPWEARINELFEEQDRTMDMNQRQKLFHEIQQIMAEQLPVIPLLSRHTATAVSARVGNYRPSPIIPYSLWNADEMFIK